MVIKSIGNRLVTTLIVLIFMFSAVSVISANTTDPNAQEQQNMVIQGMVFDALTQKPIVNAHVLLWNEIGEYRTITAEDGGFVFKVPKSAYNIKVGAEGYNSVEEYLGPTDSMEIALTFSIKPIEERPDPMYVIGYVYDGATEQPIVGAVVYFYGHYHNSKTRTGDTGGFEMKLPPGFYKVEVQKEGYYPWVDEISGESNDKLELKILMKPQSDNNHEPRLVYVEGTVYVINSERPIPGAKILMMGETGFVGDAQTNDDGYFEMELPEGIYHVQVWAEGFNEVFEIAEILNVEKFYMKLFAEPLQDHEQPEQPENPPVDERERPQLSGRVFDAPKNEPMMAEVVLEPEFVIPKMQYLVLGMRWGMLDCEETACFAGWDGFIQVTDGQIRPVRTIAWETGGEYRKGTDDMLYRPTNPMTVEWRSSTVNCWDGILVFIAVPENAEPAPHVTIHTEQWSKVVEFKDLADVHRTIQIDDCGNELEIRTKLLRMPDLEKPERPPKDEDPNEPPDVPPDMPPDGPQDRPENNRPPKEEPRNTRGETDHAPQVFGLEIPEEQFFEIHKSVMDHYRGQRLDKIITKTNDRGFYAFRELRPGHYRMWVKAPGYIEYYNEFTIGPEQHMVIDVYLRPMIKDESKPRPCIQVVKGIVVEARTGEPVANAKVSFDRILEQKTDMDNTVLDIDKERLKTFSVMTNERGYFEIKLPCGLYKMTVQARGYEAYIQRLEVGGETPVKLKIPLKKTADPNSAENSDPALSDSSGGEGVDTKSLGVQLYDGDAVNGAMQALLVALLILGVLLPLLMVVKQQKTRKKPQRTQKRRIKTSTTGKKRIHRVSAKNPVKKDLKETTPHFSKPMREF